jgi:outer membrane protein TolC
MIFMALGVSLSASAQLDSTGVSAGFFDSSASKTINFSNFHLPPLAVLFENAKMNPKILTLAKAQEIAQAEVAKQKRHIFSYVTGHASYGYGKTDMWGNNSSTYSSIIYQYQGSVSSYWNIGVNLAVPVEDILDLKASIQAQKIGLVEKAQIA